jgi:ribonuclease HII
VQQGTLEGAGFEGIGHDPGDLERWCRRRGVRWLIGVDEAGRGPLAGPVHAAAVALDCQTLFSADVPEWFQSLDDSKKLEAEDRLAACERIQEETPAWSIETASHREIDAVNILQATRRAMAEAVEGVVSMIDGPVDWVFVDGNVGIEVSHPQRALVGGDGRSWAIGAASILAKVSRDRVMVDAHESWPAYDFSSNKGYPTAAHREALKSRGPCPIHRRSFNGVPDSGDPD